MMDEGWYRREGRETEMIESSTLEARVILGSRPTSACFELG
jgi:hypothetical protein